MKQKRIFEPFFWSLFGAGGAMAALLLPVLIIIFAIAVPLGLISPPSYETLSGVLDSWLVRLAITAVITLCMFHWAHRFRFILEEGLQLQKYDKTIALFCYEMAFFFSVITGYIMLIQ